MGWVVFVTRVVRSSKKTFFNTKNNTNFKLSNRLRCLYNELSLFLSTMKAILFILVIISSSISCTAHQSDVEPNTKLEKQELSNYSVAYFASGCFWCVEAIYESVKGVKEVVSGYSGGTAKDANYKAVSAGITDHAEAVAVYYDPKMISYETLLVVFFDSHDPTTLNRQGPDWGRQYRSAIFYTTESEKNAAKNYIASLLRKKVFSSITTEVVELEAFYPAEEYHQDYKKKHPNDPYIKKVSNPRFESFKSKHPDLLK